jgi:hypothetical protein
MRLQTLVIVSPKETSLIRYFEAAVIFLLKIIVAIAVFGMGFGFL